MGPFSNDPNAGGPYSAGPPQGAPGWQGMQGGPAWQGQGIQGAPAWQGQGMPGVSQPQGAVPFVKNTDSKWPALRLIATVLKIVAWVEGVVGLIAALGAGGTLSATPLGGAGFLVTLFLLVGVAVGFLMTYASSEIIMLFISIEKNTRESSS